MMASLHLPAPRRTEPEDGMQDQQSHPWTHGAIILPQRMNDVSRNKEKAGAPGGRGTPLGIMRAGASAEGRWVDCGGSAVRAFYKNQIV